MMQIIPTISAIETAAKNGERDLTNYEVTKCVEHMFTVQHKDDATRTYTVDTLPGYENCQCYFFQKNGTCKHLYIVAENERIAKEEEKLSDPDYIGYIAR